MSVGLRINLNPGLYLRDPQDSELGRRIITYAIELLDELGFERFTFKRLAQRINSTEASIYRYYENKHMLLLYLVSWYWEWVGYWIDINTLHLKDPREKLKVIIHSFLFASKENPTIAFVNESKLHNVVISEGLKSYHTKAVDEENEKGYFLNYKVLANKVSQVIQEIDPDFKYPYALATNLLEMSNNHIYFAKHLPRLTDKVVYRGDLDEVETMLNYFVNRLLVKNTK
jgi:AcrR family transcriptional regulator